MKTKLTNFLRLVPILLLTLISVKEIAIPESVRSQDNSVLGSQGRPDPETVAGTGTHWGGEGQPDSSNRNAGASGDRHLSNPIERYLRWAQYFGGFGQPGSGGRTSGGSRGICSAAESFPSVTALVPEIDLKDRPEILAAHPYLNVETSEEESSTILFGRTVDGYPTFWFYVSDEASSAKSATFMLLDKDQNRVLTEPISIPLSGTSGLVSVTLPETAKELDFNKDYHWFFELECDDNNPSVNPVINGWIQRVAPIPGIEPNDYVAYAEQGIWYNALTPLVQMRQQQGQNPTLQQDWQDLLKSVGLEYLTDVSIADCCDDRPRANRL